MMPSHHKVRENRLRRKASQLGYEIRKSRARTVHLDDHGGYCLVDRDGNYFVAGQRFDLSLDDVERWLGRMENRLDARSEERSEGPYRLQSDEELDLRMSELQAAGFPAEETIRFAEGVVSYTPGPYAEAVVRQLVLDVFDQETLEVLAGKHVASIPIPGMIYCTSRPTFLIGELARRGIGSRQDAAGWRVSWPLGEAIEGKELCRVGLLAVWLKYMREEGGMETPAY